MIASLKGKIELKTDKFIILDVNGVGYKIFCTSPTLKGIKDDKKEIKFFIHLYPRENLLNLYGFLTFEEMEFFEILISVSGIGPKAALSVMMLESVKVLKQAIASGQKTLLTKVSGIGSKTAERIILELRNKVSASIDDIKQLNSDSEAIDALISLGYPVGKAREALKQVSGKIKKVEDRIKEALRIIGK
ncbi:MAG: Holliday junction branch migration protein RuvA [Patescibacteria group bacterium]|nr:Holliday junction branch migration protein RuvA [Patescibacteria group bacterium]